MTPAEETVRKLYESVKGNRPADAAECYCEDATYRDLAFDLKGRSDIAAMWRLVCSRNVLVDYCGIRTEGPGVEGYWIFRYKFQKTNPVLNPMVSNFVFRDGKILVHHDNASRWNWAKQALGRPQGALVTVLPFILRHKAKRELDTFKAGEKGG